MGERRSILLLCDDSRGHAGNVLQHIAGLAGLSRHEVRLFNPVDRPESARLLDLEEFDVVVVHYTVLVTGTRYLSAELAEKIASFRGLKVQFIQDEYRRVDAVTWMMRELGIDVLYTCAPSPACEQIYGERVPAAEAITTLTAYVPDELVGRQTRPQRDRPLDVGYRARSVPYWLGRLGQEKVEIGRGFLAPAAGAGLSCDISSSEGDRIYGERWHRFLASCRATLGTESGSSIVDFDGSIEARVKDYLVRNPGAPFEQVERDVLAPFEDVARIAVASPRLFEAAALRTAMVMFPGGYSGVVEAETHYLPLAKDFSNLHEIVERLQDTAFVDAMTARAYEDLIASRRYSLGRFVSSFDDLVEERSTIRRNGRRSAYRRATRRRRIPSWSTSPRLRAVGGRIAKPLAGLALVVRDPAVRRLTPGALRDRELGGDLWRLAALRRGLRRGAFDVDSTFDDGTGRLVLRSRPPQAGHDEPQAALNDRVAEIVWNHTEVGETIPLVGDGLIHARIGTHGVAGAHSFRALVREARRRPGPIARALTLTPDEATPLERR
jgi:hypothetical protein